MTLFYAFVTRSILATLVFRNVAMNLVVYGIIYIGLTYAFLNSFDRSHGHLYAPRGLFTIILLAIIMFYEMGVSDSLSSVRLLYKYIITHPPGNYYPSKNQLNKNPVKPAAPGKAKAARKHNQLSREVKKGRSSFFCNPQRRRVRRFHKKSGRLLAVRMR